MKRALLPVIILCICCLYFSSCSADNNSFLEIADGIRLGMTAKEANDASVNAGNPISSHATIETTIANEPFTLVYFSTVDSLDSFDSSVLESDCRQPSKTAGKDIYPGHGKT